MNRSLSHIAVLFFGAAVTLFLPETATAQCTFGGTFTSDDQIIIPSSTTYGAYRISIRARGADGGDYQGTSGRGGSGAILEAEFTVYPGDKLDIYVGEAGSTASNPPGTRMGGGGGGGSAVVINNDNVLIAAAGGGAAGGSTINPDHGRGGDASVSSVPSGGTTMSGGGAGGGGFGIQSEGESGFAGISGGGAATLQFGGDGGSGGTAPSGNTGGTGGYGFGGGGGGGIQAGGGGGGYRGGNGGVASANTYDGGSGGNSFVTGGYSATVSFATAGVTGAGQLRNGEVIVQCVQALPVELLSFKGMQKDKEVELNWITAAEINNHGFDVEHAPDGLHWQKIGFVKGNGNTAKTHSYAFTHTGVNTRLNYYRLKQIDLDGAFEYSPVITVLLAVEDDIEVFPNPTNGYLSISGLSSGEATAEISDKLGRIVKKTPLSGSQLNLSDLPPGIYLLTLTSESGSFTKRIIRQ